MEHTKENIGKVVEKWEEYVHSMALKYREEKDFQNAAYFGDISTTLRTVLGLFENEKFFQKMVRMYHLEGKEAKE